MDPFLQKVHDRPINERYRLVYKIGEGGFGAVFLGKDIVTDADVALKLEHRDIDPSILKDEAEAYSNFKGLSGFPQVFWFGEHDDYRVMAFTLLGPSLDDLTAYCGKFSLKTVLMLVDQILHRLEDFHGAGFLHRDIKPDNFLLGTGKHGNTVFMADLGTAILFSDWKYEDYRRERTSKFTPILIGTQRFASVRAHRGELHSPKDDLEALGYTIIHLLTGYLPWQDVDDDSISNQSNEPALAIMKFKSETDPADLCRGLPKEFLTYVRYVNALQPEDEPDYEYLRQIFRKLAAQKGFEYDNVFDWTERLYMEAELAKRRR